MKRSRSSFNLVELGLGAPLLPSKKLQRALLSSSASSEQLAERLRLSSMGTHPFHAANMTMSTLTRRPALAKFMPCPRALDTLGTGARHPTISLPQHIITYKLHDGCQDDENENCGPNYPPSSSCVPAWASPPAHDGPCHGPADDEDEDCPCPLTFKKQNGFSCPSPTWSTLTATTTATSSSGSYISDSELFESDGSGTNGGGSGTPSASSTPTEADIMHKLVREMERLYNTQQEQLQQQHQHTVRTKELSVRSIPRRPFSLHCWEDRPNHYSSTSAVAAAAAAAAPAAAAAVCEFPGLTI